MTDITVYNILGQRFETGPSEKLEPLGIFGTGPGNESPPDEVLLKATHVEPLTPPGEYVAVRYYKLVGTPPKEDQ